MKSGDEIKVFYLEGQTVYASLLNDVRSRILYGIQFINPSNEVFVLCSDLKDLISTGLVAPA